MLLVPMLSDGGAAGDDTISMFVSYLSYLVNALVTTGYPQLSTYNVMGIVVFN